MNDLMSGTRVSEENQRNFLGASGSRFKFANKQEIIEQVENTKENKVITIEENESIGATVGTVERRIKN